MNSRIDKLSGKDVDSVFQSYTKKDNIFLSSEIDEYMAKQGVIYKYIPIDNFLRSFHEKIIYLSSPYKWEDPYEVKYLEWLKNNTSVSGDLRQLNVFAMCFAKSLVNEEASWKVYKNYGENFVRLAIDRRKFVYQLRRNEEKAYLTDVVYKSRKEILEDVYIMRECSVKELFLQNFSMKQLAYKYEKEIRLCAFGGETDHLLIHDFDWKETINSITFPPFTMGKDRGLYDMYHYYLTNRLGFTDNQIRMSRLYDKNEDKMTSIYRPKYNTASDRHI